MLTTAALALLVIAPQLFTYHEGFEWPWAIGAYLFVPWPHSSGVSVPVIGVGWTLNYEMYFYLAFACALMFRSGLSVLATFFCASVAAGFMLGPAHPWLRVLTGPLLVEFLLGMAVALLVRQVHAPKWVSGSAIILGATIIVLAGYAEEFRVVYWGLPAAMIVAGVVWLAPRCEGKAGRALVLVGDASYSVYLFQVFALPGLALVLKRLALLLPADIAIAVLWLCARAMGILCWRFVERPLTRCVRSTADHLWQPHSK